MQMPLQSLNIDKFRAKLPVLNDITVNDYFNAHSNLLIGLPHIKLVRPYGFIDLDDNFSVQQTKLENFFFDSNV